MTQIINTSCILIVCAAFYMANMAFNRPTIAKHQTTTARLMAGAQ